MVAYFEGRLRRGELTPESLGRQRAMVRDFAVSYGARPVTQFSVKAVDRWLETIAELSPGTRRGRIGVVRRFCSYLHAECGYPDVTRAFPRVRVPRTVPRSIPHGEVVRIFAQATEKRDRAILTLIFYQALRVAEVGKLRVEDYDGESLFVRGKGGHERILPAGEHCQRALDDWLRERGTVPGPLFPGEKPGEGLKPNTISHYVSEWMWNSGVKKRARDGKTAHAGRHTAATKAARNGVSVWGIQELLGHASPATSAIYTRGAGSTELKRAVEGDYQSSS